MTADRAVEPKRDKVKIIVILGHIFLQEQGCDEVKVTSFGILVHFDGKWEMWMAQGGKTAQEDSYETRPQAAGKGRRPWPRVQVP